MKRLICFLTLLATATFAPLVLEAQSPSGKKAVVNGREMEGTPLTCDLPEGQHIRNIGSKLDGAGMCVFSSIEMAARYQGLEEMRGWRDWCAERYPGGGYPTKVDKLLDAYWKAKGMQPLPYAQYEGSSPETFLDLIDKTGRMASITYGQGERYNNQLIAHMTNCVLYRGRFGVTLDNNFPGERAYEWVERPELIRRARITMRGNLGAAWIHVWLTPPPPPPPAAN